MANPSHTEQPNPKRPKWLDWLYIAIVIVVVVAASAMIWWVTTQIDQQNDQSMGDQPQVQSPQKSTERPQLTTEIVLSGLDHVWEIAFLPTKEMLFTERSGMVRILKDGNRSDMFDIADANVQGEGGLLGLAVDPEFTNNHFIYTCFNSAANKDIRVVRWQLKSDLSGVDSSTAIVTGMPANTSGRHSGCRLAFSADGYLWIGTGDSAQGDTGIQPKSLGGKILRVDRGGNAAPGNIGGQYDARIYSYGHRNVQGLAFYKESINGIPGISVEHGSNVDDEVNLLVPGNFGWAPPASGYNETGVPMTDKTRFPDAVEAIWSSGSPTQAPSGATFVNGKQWEAWDGALFVAVLKATHLKVLTMQDNKVIGETRVFEGDFGRIRTVVQGPDGNLYISTDNGGDDKIIRIVPN